VHVELPEAILEITDEHRLPGADPRYGPVVVGPVVLDLARCSRSAGFDARGAPQVCHRGRRDHRVNQGHRVGELNGGRVIPRCRGR
jgi:hypothetical protein